MNSLSEKGGASAYVYLVDCTHKSRHIQYGTFCVQNPGWYPEQNEPPRDKTNKMICAPSEDSDQPGIRPVSSESSLCAQWVAKDMSFFFHADSEDTSDWADARADLNLR